MLSFYKNKTYQINSGHILNALGILFNVTTLNEIFSQSSNWERLLDEGYKPSTYFKLTFVYKEYLVEVMKSDNLASQDMMNFW